MQLNHGNPEQLCRDLEAATIRLTEARAGAQLQETALSQAGVYNNTPSESWEGRYLRLVYPTDTDSGQRNKEYVGCKPENIAAHKQKLLRTADWRQLRADIRTMDNALDGIERRLRELTSMTLNVLEHRPEATGIRALRVTAALSCTLSQPESGQPTEIAP